MSVRTRATHLYCFHVGCSCTSPMTWCCSADTASACVEGLSMGRLVDEVHEREDRDPDHVHEVPVQGRDVDEQRVFRAESALHVDREECEQPEHARRDVRAVEAREREERRTKQVRANGEALVHERGELV